MKILQICAAYKPAYVYGGPTMSVSMLSENLARAGIHTEVYATTANGKGELPVIPGASVNVDGVTVTYFKRMTKDHSHFSPALLSKLKREVKYFDIVHIHAWWNLVSIFSCLIATRQKVPVMLSPRGTLSPYSFQNKSIGAKWMLHQLLGKSLLRRCFIHATTQRESDAIGTLFQPKGVFTLPNFVKLPVQKTFPEKKHSQTFKLLFFSRVEEKKGLDLLLRALPEVTVPFELTIAGDGDAVYLSSLKALIAELNIAGKIKWIGFQNENKFDMLQKHDLFILPSYDENFGNVVIESLSVGTPVLISDQVGLADYVKENQLGWICHTNPSSIAWEVNNIFITWPDELKTIRKKAPEIIYRDFDDDNLVKKYIEMYEQLVT
ncbi:MAG TPA: glycosyltransferase [Mucilaginibacter sp.]|nr:glycosyltransferase [Mucilaginibacter sp.]